MSRPPLQSIQVNPDQTIVEAVAAIDRGTMGIALVIAADGKLVGTVTDGDVRRALLQGIATERPVSEIMSSESTVVDPAATPDSVLSTMLFRKLKQVPIVDGDGRVVGLHLLDDLVRHRQRTNPVLIFAGGEGTRLGALTKETPKPLLPLGPNSKPILDVILDDLRAAGFGNIHLAVRYLSSQIMERYGDGSALGLNIRYIEEPSPLGTAGALAQLVGTSGEPILALNADVVTTLNFSDLLEFHRAKQYQATVAVRELSFRLPYGVVEFDEEKLAGILEKPIHRVSVNAGIYVVEPTLVHLVPADTQFDMTDLFAAALDSGHHLGAFPIAGAWHDIGQPEDLRRAREEYGGET